MLPSFDAYSLNYNSENTELFSTADEYDKSIENFAINLFSDDSALFLPNWSISPVVSQQILQQTITDLSEFEPSDKDSSYMHSLENTSNSYSNDSTIFAQFLNSNSGLEPTESVSNLSSFQSSSEDNFNLKKSDKTSAAKINSEIKRKRGRPPIEQSIAPSVEQLEQADPHKRRYLEQRFKNNEASRISRRNRKRKEDQVMIEEYRELEKNKTLKAQYDKLTNRHEFLKNYLRYVIQLK